MYVRGSSITMSALMVSGYPEGLKGNEIPTFARIIAIADAFDAMTSNRPYRKALPFEVALNEISKGKGTQFDPEIVNAFLKVSYKFYF
jgi:HD-GYP domain-containing protein (c-di-GMP phosphodiesterase class II)